MSGARIGVIADVHGNLPALEVALRELDREGVDRLVCAGDLVGYGPFPNECVARVREAGAACVAGNHDLMAIGRLDEGHADGLARETIAWTRGALAPGVPDYLGSLRPSVTEEGLTMAHGSVDDPTVYVYADGAATQLAAVPAGALLVLGHTHVPLAFGERRGALVDGRAGDVAIEAGERLLVNPGSVGQPREWRVLVRFAIVDLGAARVSFRALGYD
ncbi:MAG TPA: metallophosphoesterase family protein, partial [Thermoleophilaceae bacterium]|nr:metallophosphoesterase family protein [Thermoleophilaceae bacterium]